MFARFLRNRSGSVLPTFAIALIPLLVSTGAVIDYTNAFDEKQMVQDAMDSAALAAGKQIGKMTTDEVKVEAANFFDSNIDGKVTQTPTLLANINGATIDLTTTLHVKTYFLGLIGLDEFVFNLTAQATLGLGTVEVALALDNSGSMSGTKIATLITAATDLANTLYGLGTTSTEPDPVKVALVPFASSVKVDPANKTAAWMDTTGIAPYNAESFEGATGSPPVSNNTPSGINVLNMFDTLSGTGSAWAGCVEERQAPYDVQDDPADTATPATMFVPMFAPDEPDNWTCTTGSCSYAGSSSSNRRYNGAPTGSQDYNNYLPDAGTATTCPTAFPTITAVNTSSNLLTSNGHGLTAGTQVMFSSTGSLPNPLNSTSTYYVISSGLTTNAFKVSTSSGGSAVNITNAGSGTRRFTKPANWTCQSGNANCGGSGNGKSEQTALLGQNIAAENLCKYGTVANKAAISTITVDTNGGGTYPGGPNFNCTTQAVTPLTVNQTTVTDAIGDMVADGTTNITAGLMWGWRVLSPTAPFTDGRAYSVTNNQKYLILMTDGENTYFANGKFPVSYYGAWGYIWKSHLGTTSSDEDDMQAKMEERMELACTNVKQGGDLNNPGDDITIYTVAFEITDADTLQLLEDCATDPVNGAFNASDPAGLLAAFTAIGDQISLLRISQ